MEIQNEVITFFTSCLLGAFFSFYYDCFRILRKIIPHHGVLVFFQDIFYFASSSIIVFSFISQTFGVIRGFLLIGIILGYILYFFTIGIIFMKVADILFVIIKKIFLISYNVIFKIVLIIIIPIKLILMLFHYFYTKLKFFLSILMKTHKKYQ